MCMKCQTFLGKRPFGRKISVCVRAKVDWRKPYHETTMVFYTLHTNLINPSQRKVLKESHLIYVCQHYKRNATTCDQNKLSLANKINHMNRLQHMSLTEITCILRDSQCQASVTTLDQVSAVRSLWNESSTQGNAFKYVHLYIIL